VAQLDNIPAMLQSGEYVVRKEAVDKLGKNTMDMINNADRLGYAGGGLVPQGEYGHSAIDELLALNTLANQKSVDMTRDSAMMNKGGKVALPGIPGEYVSKKSKREPNPMSLGLMGSLLSRAFLSDGELVPNYGEFNRLLMNNPEPGDRLTPEEMILKELLGMKDGGMMDNYMYGGMSKKKKKKGYEDGGSVGVVDEMGKARKMFSELDEILQTAALMDRYDFGSSQRGALSALREADVVDPKEAVQQVMMLLNAREKGVADAGPYSSRKGYQEGGQFSPDESIKHYYDTFGYKPTDSTIQKRFEELYKYDPSEALGNIDSLTREASMELMNRQPDATGFFGSGARGRKDDELRTDLYSSVGRTSEDIISESREEATADALQFLQGLTDSDAEMVRASSAFSSPTAPSGAPSNPDVDDEYEYGGSIYRWNGSSWVIVQQGASDTGTQG